jgi:O-antigen/teichoic acid export membrane protein
MSDLRDIATSSAKGTFILTLGRYSSIVASTFGVVLVARMLSPSEYGLYGLTLVLPRMFILLCDWGVNQGLVKFLSQHSSRKMSERVLGVGISGLVFKLLLGGICFITLFFSAGFLAKNFQGRPELEPYIRLSSFLVLFQTLYTTGFSILVGLDKMEGKAIMDVVQGLVKGILSPVLVYFGFGIIGAVLGHVLSFIMSAIVGLILIFLNFKNVKGDIFLNINMKEEISLLVGYGIPLFVGTFFTGIVLRFRDLLLSWYISTEIIGNFNVALRFISLIGVITSSIGMVLFPTFSRFSFNEEGNRLRMIFQSSIRYASLFVVPIVFYLILASENVVELVFSGRYSFAPLFIKLLLIPELMVGLGSISTVRLLNSQGDTDATMRISLFSSGILALLSLVLVWFYGITGFIISLVLSRLSGVLLGLILVYRRYRFFPFLRRSGSVYVSSILASIISYFFSRTLGNKLVQLTFSGVLFIVIYLIAIPFFGGLDEKDLDDLDVIFRRFWVLYPFIRFLIRLERRILLYFRGK